MAALLATVASVTLAVGSASAATALANPNTVVAVDPAIGPTLNDAEWKLYGWYASEVTCLTTGETVGALPVVLFWYCGYNQTCGLWALMLLIDMGLAAGTPADRQLASLALSKSGGGAARPTSSCH